MRQVTVPSSQIADSCVGGNYFQPATFDLDGVSVAAGKYALVLDAVGAAGGGLYWRRSSTPSDVLDPYAAGTLYSTDVFGDGWQSYDHLDCAFDVDAVEPCE